MSTSWTTVGMFFLFCYKPSIFYPQSNILEFIVVKPGPHPAFIFIRELQSTGQTSTRLSNMAEQDKSAGSAETVGSKNGMPQGDVDFLIACLKNTMGGPISVSIQSIHIISLTEPFLSFPFISTTVAHPYRGGFTLDILPGKLHKPSLPVLWHLIING